MYVWWMNEWLQRPKFVPVFISEDYIPFPSLFCVSAKTFLENIQETQANARRCWEVSQGLVPKDGFPGSSGAHQHPTHCRPVDPPLEIDFCSQLTLFSPKLLIQKYDAFRAGAWIYLKSPVLQVQELNQIFQNHASQTTGSAWYKQVLSKRSGREYGGKLRSQMLS